MRQIMRELTDIAFSIRKYPFSLTIPLRIFELPLIRFPLIVFQQSEICKIEFALNKLRIVIVDNAFAIELIFLPVTLICYFALGVVKGAIALHVIILPFAVVEAAVFVVEFAVAVSLVVFFETLIFCAVLVVLY